MRHRSPRNSGFVTSLHDCSRLAAHETISKNSSQTWFPLRRGFASYHSLLQVLSIPQNKEAVDANRQNSAKTT